MVLINTEIAMMGTRVDLAIFDIMRYKEVCMQGVHAEPDSVALANPSKALEQPLVMFWHDRHQIRHSAENTDINHYVKIWHPYAKYPLTLSVNQRLVITGIQCRGDDYNKTLDPVLGDSLTPLSSRKITLKELIDALYVDFPPTIDIDRVDVNDVIDRHTLKSELITLA